MRNYAKLLLLTLLSTASLSLIGCADSPQPKVEENQWLMLGKEFGEENLKGYKELVNSVADGDAESTVKLSVASQQIADQLMQSGKRSEAFKFYVQSAKALRLAIEFGTDDLPYPTYAGAVYFDEAKALSVQGETKRAISALDESYKNGFDDIDSLLKLNEFSNARADEQYESMLPTWTELAKTNLKKEVRRKLSANTSYPFTFSGTDVNGQKHSLEGLAGKVVIVDFWGTWCRPCVNELPSFVSIQEEYGDQDLQVIGLNYENGTQAENARKIKRMIEKVGINYPCIQGDEATQGQLPEPGIFPTTVFVDKAGKVRLTLTGGQREAFLEAIVVELLAE